VCRVVESCTLAYIAHSLIMHVIYFYVLAAATPSNISTGIPPFSRLAYVLNKNCKEYDKLILL